MDQDNIQEQLKCESCGNDDISPDDVDIYGTDGIDIRCPECDNTTQRRWASNEVNPDKLFRGL